MTAISIENVQTVKDLILEASKKFNTKIYISYRIENEVRDVSYHDMAQLCETFTVWVNQQEKPSSRNLHVGLLSKNNYNFVIVYLASMFSGNVSIPMDPTLDLDTTTYCIDHGDVDILFYDPKYQSKVDLLKKLCPNVKQYISLYKVDNNNDIPCLENILQKYQGQSIQTNIKPSDNALIIYTSGTTGKKKGGVITHENLIDKTFSTLDIEQKESEVYLSMLPLYHIFASDDFLFTMRDGSRVCINDDLSKYMEDLIIYQPTTIRIVPLIAKNLMNSFNMAKTKNPNKSLEEIKKTILGENLYRICTGGSYLDPQLGKDFGNLGIAISQKYAMTESAGKGTLTYYDPKKILTLGVPAPNSEIRIKDEEIQIKSKSLMKEYYKDPEKTKEAFTEDGWLRTGDLGYFDEDNYLCFKGRIKNLIILSNGENVSPEGIENLYIKSEPLIQEIIVYDEDDNICAEVYPNMEYAKSKLAVNCDDDKELKKAVWKVIENRNKDLPNHERISRLSIRQEPFVKTATKKIIRRVFMDELKKRKEEMKANGKDQLLLPTNDTQKRLYDIVSGAIGNSNFGIDSDLNEFGLDSFNSTIITNCIGEEFDIHIKLNHVINNPTILKLEKVVNDICQSDKKNVDLSKRDVYPISSSQRSCIKTYKGNTIGNIVSIYKLHPDIDIQLLKTSLEKLFDIHVELKGSLGLDEEGQYKNYRNDESTVEIPIIRISDEEWENKNKNGTLAQPYNFEKGEPLQHTCLYQTDSNNYLYFDISHVISDGFSFKKLMDELDDIYSGRPVEPKNFTFYEFTLLENATNIQDIYRRMLGFYGQLLEGLTLHGNPFVRSNPTLRIRPKNSGFNGTFEKLNMDEITEFCKNHSVTENIVFSIAATHALNIIENIKDSVINNANNGRENDGWKRAIGFFAKFYAFRFTEVDNETVDDALRRSAKQVLKSICNEQSYLAFNSFFFQFQDDIMDINSIGDKPIILEPFSKDSIFLQFSIFKKQHQYIYMVRFWENIYDEQQLKIYINLVEEIILAMIHETKYIKDLINQIPKEYFTTKRTISVEELHEAIGKKIITSCEDEKNTMINAYILNDQLEPQVIGGWGDLYIEEIKDKNDVVVKVQKGIQSIDYHSIEDGKEVIKKLYKTRYTGKFLPDGTMNILENNCRLMMMGKLGFDDYRSINCVEKLLCEYEGIDYASLDIKFSRMQHHIIAHIYGEQEPDMNKLKEYLSSKLEDKRLIPTEILWKKEESDKISKKKIDDDNTSSNKRQKTN